MSKRGSTGAGRHAALPVGRYEPQSQTADMLDTLVRFSGEDGRSREYDVSSLPLAGWHEALLPALRERLGPTGSLRTLKSAHGLWDNIKRFMMCLAKQPDCPDRPDNLRASHITQFALQHAGVAERTLREYLHAVGSVLGLASFAGSIDEEALSALSPRGSNRPMPQTGYSDREFESIVTAARSEVVALVARLQGAVTVDTELVEITRRTGAVPVAGVAARNQYQFQRRHAEQCFVTRRDLIPLFILFVALSGWNVECIKELPTEHRIVGGKSVEIELTKRRRGRGRWANNGSWEIGRPGRELYNPGGLYLLAHELLAHARALLGTDSFWAVWVPQGLMPNRVVDQFKDSLDLGESLHKWVERHELTADPLADSGVERPSEPLDFSFGRLKTSVDVRRTKEAGGHLPSAALSNTEDVLFSNYLSGDPTAKAWSEEVVSEALSELEQTALENHRELLARGGRTALEVRVLPPGQPNDTGRSEEMVWNSCEDHDHHPISGRRCGQSLLACFSCANCVITSKHLPQIVALLDTIEDRQAILSEALWWRRYGAVWTAIRHSVLPRFTEAEVEQARTQRAEPLLDLVEPGWEMP